MSGYVNPETGLSDQQELFCQEYLVDLSQIDAARRAGYSTKNAYKTGSRLMKNKDVLARIRELMATRTEATRVTQIRVVAELARIGFSNMTEIMEWDHEGVHWYRSNDLPERVAAAVAEVKETTREFVNEEGDSSFSSTRSIKLHPKLSALSELAKHVGISGPAGAGINVNLFTGQSKDQEAAEYKKLFDEIDTFEEQTGEKAPPGLISPDRIPGD